MKPSLHAWARLVRLPNTFTVVADVLAGLSLARGSWNPWPLTVLLVIATVALYWAGMILNDVFDVEKDRLQNRGRPLVDGSISTANARFVGFQLLLSFPLTILSLVICVYGGIFDTNSNFIFEPFATLFVAIALAIVIYLYDGPLKATFFGPILMGLCRVGSLLIGISVGWWMSPQHDFTTPHLWLASFANGMFITGVTTAARKEAEQQQSLGLPVGWLIATVGVLGLAIVPWLAPAGTLMRLRSGIEYPIAIALMALPWARRAFHSLAEPNPKTIQLAVKQAILSLIFFDAVLALQFGGIAHAISICALAIPASILGRFFRST
jgi:4-hydroxybenzoate polyprenyltransferase